MLREITKILFALIVLTIPSANCAQAQNSSELLTDTGVIAALQRIKDAKIKLMGDEKLDAKTKNSRRLEARDVCIERLKETSKIIVIAFFRNDYGCHFEGAFVGSRFYDAVEILNVTKPALESLGWQKANRAMREQLALWWTEKILHAFDEVFYPNRMNPSQDKGVQPPQSATRENGDVIVTLWIQPPPNNRGKKSPKRFEYIFKADGSLSGATSLAAGGFKR